jgi:hypothetical protein
MERLFDLLTELSVDPFKQQAFARDPEAFAASFGLGEEERAALSALRAGAPSAGPPGLSWSRAMTCVDPGPDPMPDPDPPIFQA